MNSFLLFIFVIYSCQEAKNNKPFENAFEEISDVAIDCIKPSEAIIKVDTLNRQISIITEIDSILPNPHSTFFIDLDASDVKAILTKYVNSFNIRNTFTDNNDGSYEIELRNYSFKEVNRVLKILLPKENEANTDLDGWSKGIYHYYSVCNLEVIKGNNTIILDFGCSC